MRTIFLLAITFLLLLLSCYHEEILLLLLTGCHEENQPVTPAPPPALPQAKVLPTVPPPPGCRGCHADIQLDPSHDFVCTACHQGDDSTNEQAAAHQGLNTTSEKMTTVCGGCHSQQLEGCAQSKHFTLNNEVNLIRSQFGMKPVGSLREIPEPNNPLQNKEDLLNDLLRRRCLRCHLGTAGDSYPSVQRGRGCAACHLRKVEGKLPSHAFSLPSEQQCLSCHYGNRVGSDFVGMYEHDLSSDFRSPQVTKAPYLRPYGVEQHDLASDIHQQRGLTCLDCHNGAELSGKQPAVTCSGCHAPELGHPPFKNIQSKNGQRILTGRASGKQHPIPQLQHPAHAKYGDRVACQVCHAQWSFNDQGTHLLLSYSDEVKPWRSFSVQGSAEVEAFFLGDEENTPRMSDTLSGKKKLGIWLQGYGLRRWEKMLIQQDNDGIIKVFRPLLDLHLSAVDKDGKVLAGLDNITGKSNGMLPYTPHTTGPAGLFYERRFLHLLKKDTAADREN